MIYKAKLSQSGTNHPTAEVFENTLGCEVNWARPEFSIEYIGTFDPPFTEGARILCHNPVRDNSGDVTTGSACVFTMDGYYGGVSINSYGTPEDGSLQRRDIEGAVFVCFEVFE